MVNQFKTYAITLCVWTIAISIAHAHPNHASVAEMQFNEKSGKLEIAMRVWPVDLEKSLSKMHGKHVDIDKAENVDQLITDYLSKAFQVKDAAAKALSINWVGKEVNLKHAWLYFEIPIESLQGLEFSNGICFEAERTQVNTILFQHKGQRLSLQCSYKKPIATLDLNMLK